MDMKPAKRARQLLFAAGLAGLLSSGGCATIAPGVEHTNAPAGGYSGGRTVQDFPRDPQTVSAAIAQSLDDLKMVDVKRQRDGTVYKIVAKTEDNRPVLVTARPHQDQTRVGCRIGWFGDEPLSKAVMERTGIRLELLPPAPIADKPPSSPEPNPFLLRDTNLQNGMIRDMLEAPYRDRPGPS
jgi:Protein of unknown function (DUF3568)